MGWGEPLGRSTQMVADAEYARAAEVLATRVETFMEEGTTGNRERMGIALVAYNAAKSKMNGAHGRRT